MSAATANRLDQLAAALVAPFSSSSTGAGSGGWTQDQGVDVPLAAHTPLYAVGSGTIVREGIGGFGPTAPVEKLDAPIGPYDYVYYGHTGTDKVPVGTHVTAGQQISEVGAGIVGISTGPHLEFGFANAAGAPAPGSSNAAKNLLSQTVGKHNPSGGGGGGGVLDTVGSAVGDVGSAVGNALGFVAKGPQALAGAVIDAIASWLGPIFARIGLYVLLVGGAVALLVMGTSRAAGMHPAQAAARAAAIGAVA